MNRAVVASFCDARSKFLEWRCSLSIYQKVLLALGMAALTGVFAQARVYLPFSPVPVTGQTLAVLLAGVFLGKNWGGFSQALYVILGAVGIPWLAGGGSGLIIFGPTGGYLLGFVLAAFFIGYITDKFIRARQFFFMLLLMLIANFVLIHVPGLIYLGLWFSLAKGAAKPMQQLILIGTVPFIVGDLLKIFIAAGAARVFTPRKPYV